MSPSSPLFGPFKLSFFKPPHLRIPETPIQAGFPSPADDYLLKDLDLNELFLSPRESTFGFYVQGESMAEMEIHTGDIVVVNTVLDRRPGMAAVAGINGEFVVKILGYHKNQPALLSKNPAYPPIILKEFDELLVFGVVRGMFRDFFRRLR